MAFAKFEGNRFKIAREIAENHAILVNLTASSLDYNMYNDNPHRRTDTDNYMPGTQTIFSSLPLMTSTFQHFTICIN